MPSPLTFVNWPMLQASRGRYQRNQAKKERKKNAEAWISGSGSVTADRQVEQDGEDEQWNETRRLRDSFLERVSIPDWRKEMRDTFPNRVTV